VISAPLLQNPGERPDHKHNRIIRAQKMVSHSALQTSFQHTVKNERGKTL